MSVRHCRRLQVYLLSGEAASALPLASPILLIYLSVWHFHLIIPPLGYWAAHIPFVVSPDHCLALPDDLILHHRKLSSESLVFQNWLLMDFCKVRSVTGTVLWWGRPSLLSFQDIPWSSVWQLRVYQVVLARRELLLPGRHIRKKIIQRLNQILLKQVWRKTVHTIQSSGDTKSQHKDRCNIWKDAAGLDIWIRVQFFVHANLPVSYKICRHCYCQLALKEFSQITRTVDQHLDGVIMALGLPHFSLKNWFLNCTKHPKYFDLARTQGSVSARPCLAWRRTSGTTDSKTGTRTVTWVVFIRFLVAYYLCREGTCSRFFRRWRFINHCSGDRLDNCWHLQGGGRP